MASTHNVMTAVACATLVWGGGARATDPDPPANPAQVAPDDDALRAGILAVERVHRDRMARLRRLREMAWEQDSQQRLAELDGLQQRIASDHGRRLDQLRAALSDKARERLDEPHVPDPEVRQRQRRRKVEQLELRQQARRQREDLRAATRQEQLLLQRQVRVRASAPADAPSGRRAPNARAGDQWRAEASAAAATDQARRTGRTRDAWVAARVAELQRRQVVDRMRAGTISPIAAVEPSQRTPARTQADRRAEKTITQDNADEEFERLCHELADGAGRSDT